MAAVRDFQSKYMQVYHIQMLLVTDICSEINDLRVQLLLLVKKIGNPFLIGKSIISLLAIQV